MRHLGRDNDDDDDGGGQDCWPVWCTPCARNFPMVKSSIVYWISQNLAQSPLMYYNIQYGIRFIKTKYISV